MSMKRKFTCRICHAVISQDRYNLTLKLERQDFPGVSQWQSSTPVCLETICDSCQARIVIGIKMVVDSLVEEFEHG